MRGKEGSSIQPAGRVIPLDVCGMGENMPLTAQPSMHKRMNYNALYNGHSHGSMGIMIQLKEMYGILDYQPFHFCGARYHNRSTFLSEVVTSLQAIHQNYDHEFV